jgi:hypothetical protein
MRVQLQRVIDELHISAVTQAAASALLTEAKSPMELRQYCLATYEAPQSLTMGRTDHVDHKTPLLHNRPEDKITTSSRSRCCDC